MVAAAAAAARQPPWKAKGSAASTTKRKRKAAALPPLLLPGTAVEVLRNGCWVGRGTVTIRNDRTYMVRLEVEGMTVLVTRGSVRPVATASSAGGGSGESHG